MTDHPAPDGPTAPGDDHPPLFGSWPNAYRAVIACALAVMALIAWFSSTGW